MREIECHRDGCEETFIDQLKYDLHLLRDHDPIWEADGYPRPPRDR